MSYQRLAEAVLVDWREVEFQILQRPVPSSEVASLEAEATDLRREYEQLIDAARRDGRPEPPPFPIDQWRLGLRERITIRTDGLIKAGLSPSA